ncbi:MAG: hypothetical protein KKB74_05455, partial [Bacteroidetes bacterium]|nr:hypothetical protein [Bacteroidota bacterium]
MVRVFTYKQKILLALFALQMVFVCNVESQILTFEFSALAGNEVSAASNTNDANLSSSTITRGSGVTSGLNGGRFNSLNWTTSSSIDANDYVEFTITPNPGYQFSVSSIYMQHQRSGTGPVSFALRSSIDGYATDLGGVHTIGDVTATQNYTFTFTQTDQSVSVTYRIYAYSAEAGTGTWGPGDGAGNDIIVNGTTSAIAGCSAPSTQASSITFSSVNYTSMTVNWTNGNGSKRIVIMNTSNSFTNPTNGTDPAANPVYGGSGQQVVYNNTGNSVAVSGLSPGVAYWYRVYEYNCIGTSTMFITSTESNNPNSQSTLACLAPSTQASSITFSSVNYTSMTVNWTSGNGSKRIVIMNTSNSFTNPTNGTDPAANPVYGGSGQQVVY